MRSFDCLCSCLTYSENYFGNQLEDFMLYFMVGSRSHICIETSNTLLTDSHTLLEEKVGELFVSELNDSSIRSKSLEEYITDCHSNNQIIIASVQSKLLKYRDIFTNNQESEHYICICDYSAEKRQVLIVDLYTPNYEDKGFQGWVDFEEIRLAWKEYKFLHYILEKSYVDYSLTEQQVTKAVKDTIFNYIDASLEKKQESGMDIVSKWIDKLTDETDMDNLIYQLNVTGFITIKRYLMEYFEYYNVLNREIYKNIIMEWDKLCLFLYFMKIKKRSNTFALFREKAHELLEKKRIILFKILGKI